MADARVLIISSENSSNEAEFVATIENVTFRHGVVNKSGGGVQLLIKANYTTGGGTNETDKSMVIFNNVHFIDNEMTGTAIAQKGGGLGWPGKAIKLVQVNNCLLHILILLLYFLYPISACI